MSIKKPYYRNYRKMKPGFNSGYSEWAYIVDRSYALEPEHYTRAFSIIQSDIIRLFEFVEPTDINCKTYSFRIHELLMRTCIEVEANFKAILRENTFSPVHKSGSKKGTARSESTWNINDFKIVNATHHLDAYKVEIPFWKGSKRFNQPFYEWGVNKSLSWYQAYNQSKHDRHNNFQAANFENLLLAYSGLFVLLSSQFGTESFSTGESSLGITTDSYYNGEFGLGGFLMIEFPNNWLDQELYDFDWHELKHQADRFEKIDYNSL